MGPFRFDLVWRDPGRAKGIRRPMWPRARTVNEIPSGRMMGFQRAPHEARSPPPRRASSEITAPCTCAVLPPVAVVHVSSMAPRRARVPPSGAAAYLLAVEWQSLAQRSAGPWLRRGASSASTLLPSRVAAAAATISPSQRWPRACANVQPCPCPAPPCSARACLARTVRLSVCNGISAQY